MEPDVNENSVDEATASSVDADDVGSVDVEAVTEGASEGVSEDGPGLGDPMVDDTPADFEWRCSVHDRFMVPNAGAGERWDCGGPGRCAADAASGRVREDS